MAVSGTTNQFTVIFSKLLRPITEGNDFSWTHECEVRRIEEENKILSRIVSQRDLLELSVYHSSSFERRSRAS